MAETPKPRPTSSGVNHKTPLKVGETLKAAWGATKPLKGDLCLLWVVLRHAETVPTLEVAALEAEGWVLVGVESPATGETSTHRREWVFRKEAPTNEPAEASIKAATEATSAHTRTLAIEAGTWNTVEPLNTVGEWKAEEGQENVSYAAATSTRSNCLAIASSSISVEPEVAVFPAAGWAEPSSTPYEQFNVELQSKELPAAESSGSPTFLKKAKNKSAFISRIIVLSSTGTARSGSDPVAIAEVATRVLASPRATSDAVAVAESTSFKVSRGALGSDSLVVTESAARSATSTRTDAEEGRFEELAERSAASPRATADPVKVAESTQGGAGKGSATADPVSVVEATARGSAFARVAADSTTVAEVARRALATARSSVEPITITESEGVVLAVFHVFGTVTIEVLPTKNVYLLNQRIKAVLLFVDETGKPFDPEVPPTLTANGPNPGEVLTPAVRREALGRYLCEAVLATQGTWWLVAQAPNPEGGDAAVGEVAVTVSGTP